MVRWLSPFVFGALLFTAGLIVGQTAHHSKFDRYLHPVEVTQMDPLVARANINVTRAYIEPYIPTIEYDLACNCFSADSIVSIDLMNHPLDKLRGELLGTVGTVWRAVVLEFPHFETTGVPANQDLRVTFYAQERNDPTKIRKIAEYANAELVFR